MLLSAPPAPLSAPPAAARILERLDGELNRRTLENPARYWPLKVEIKRRLELAAVDELPRAAAHWLELVERL